MQKKAEETKNQKQMPEDWENVVEFFDLLLQVDKRINPHLYENNRSEHHANQT